MAQPHISPRPELTERAFRFYEGVIQSAMSRFPDVVMVEYQDSGLSQRTFVARLRDAVKSLRTYKWTTTWDVDWTALDKLTVMMSDDGRILLGTPAARKDQIAQAKVVNVTTTTTAYIEAPVFDYLIAESYAILANQHLAGLLPLRISNKEADGYAMEMLERLEQIYDIAIVHNPNHFIIL